MSASRSGTRATSMSMPDLALARHLGRPTRSGPAAPRSWSETSRPALEQLQASTRAAWTPRTDRRSGPTGAWPHRPRRARPRPAPRRRRCRRGRSRRRTARRTLPTPAAALRISRSCAASPSAHRVDQAVGLVRAPRSRPRRRPSGRRSSCRSGRCRRPRGRAGSASARSRLAEAQRVEHRDRPRAHREDVAQDAADAGGRALERLDRARVVVRLDLERDRQPAADVHRAGVLARAHDDVRPLGRQRAQQLLASACRRSARSTAARTSPARPGWARARASRRSARTRRRVRPSATASPTPGSCSVSGNGGRRAHEPDASGCDGEASAAGGPPGSGPRRARRS